MRTIVQCGMRTAIVGCLIGVFFGGFAASAAAQEMVADVSGLALHSAFWPNLHHRLHADARTRRAAAGGTATTAKPLAQRRPMPLDRLTPDEQAAWNRALSYYEQTLAERDLRTGRDMTIITDSLSAATADSLASATAVPPEHRAALEAAAPVYRRHLWREDDGANRKWIEDVVAKLRSIEPKTTARLSTLFAMPWYDTARDGRSIRADIVHVGNARGGYTWVNPQVHVIVDSAEPNYGGWLGVEMLLHEASHGRIFAIEEKLGTAAKPLGKSKEAGELWHPVQFFIVGEVIRQALAERGTTFTPYLYATGLFDRAWAQYRPAIETHMGALIGGKSTVDEAIARLVGTL